MPNAVLEAYNTLTVEAQKEVEHLIYFLVSQQKDKSPNEKSADSIIDSFVGKCSSWKGEDALEYQNSIRAESRA